MKNKIDETMHWHSSGSLVQKDECGRFHDGGCIEICVGLIPLETGFEKCKMNIRNELIG